MASFKRWARNVATFKLQFLVNNTKNGLCVTPLRKIILKKNVFMNFMVFDKESDISCHVVPEGHEGPEAQCNQFSFFLLASLHESQEIRKHQSNLYN